MTLSKPSFNWKSLTTRCSSVQNQIDREGYLLEMRANAENEINGIGNGADIGYHQICYLLSVSSSRITELPRA